MNDLCVQVSYLEHHLRVVNSTAPSSELEDVVEWIAGTVPRLQRRLSSTDWSGDLTREVLDFQALAKKITNAAPDQFVLPDKAADLDAALDQLRKTLVLAGDSDYPAPPKHRSASIVRPNMTK